jgi:prepilin-type N-terminal cleavage/methylation domain-containing protein
MIGARQRNARDRRGMTLVEMLVATTITLIMMGLVAQLFGVFGQGVTGSRSVIELTDQMRTAGWRLRQDLGGVTAPTLPPRRPEAAEGYFELLEGPATDANAAPVLVSTDTTALTGDCDDALLFTTRSPGPFFVGRFGNGTIESPVAEVAWFCQQSPQQLPGGPTLYTLYRRQLLVMDYVGANPFLSRGNSLLWSDPIVGRSWDTFHASYDLSCALVSSTASPATAYLLPNSLRDLTMRENRFGHNATGVTGTTTFPYPAAQAALRIAPLTGSRLGEDIVLNNVLSFDVRVFDPDAPIRVGTSGGAVTPGDPGFTAASGTAGLGAYVDLFWNRAIGVGGTPVTPNAMFPPTGTTAFQTAGVAVANPFATNNLSSLSGPVVISGTAVYDTWSTHYEANGVDENRNGDVDEGTNGLDDNDNSLVDEPLEAETSAPYPVPLRGIEVRIRCYEPSSRQIRQVTIRHTFVPY